MNKIDIWDELPPDSPEVMHLEDGSNQDDNEVRLPSLRACKGLRTAAANGKSVSS